MTGVAFGLETIPQIQQFASLADDLNKLAARAERPPRRSKFAADNDAIRSDLFPAKRAMTAFVRGNTYHVTAHASAMFLLMSHPLTEAQGYRTPANSIAPHERAVIESTAYIVWVTKPQNQRTRLTRLVRFLAHDMGYTRDLTQPNRETFEAFRSTVHTYLNPEGADSALLKELDKPIPSMGALVREALDANAQRAWRSLSNMTHYSPAWETLMHTGADTKAASTQIGLATETLSALVSLHAQLLAGLRTN